MRERARNVPNNADEKTGSESTKVILVNSTKEPSGSLC